MFQAPLPALFGFLQCQLRMEAIRCLDAKEETIALTDPTAQRIWAEYARWQDPDRPNYEKWIPYHTVLGVHELFSVTEIRNAAGLDERQRFLALFVFRAHCKPDLFKKVQLPHLQREGFWADPVAAFEAGGPLEREMLDYRVATQLPLQTNAFRAIPKRLCDDGDLNLVRNITNRTQALLRVGAEVWPLLKAELEPTELFAEIGAKVQQVPGFGDTWAKMLTVAIDICYPDLGLLGEQCDVGTGALLGLQILLREQRLGNSRSSLQQAQAMVNEAACPEAAYFWEVLRQVEELGKTRHDKPLVLRQLNTLPKAMSASTLQVQLCEWRQFCDHLQRSAQTAQKDRPQDPSSPESPGTIAAAAVAGG